MLAAARIDLALFLKEIERDRHTVILRIIAVLPCAVNIRKVVNIGVVAQHLFVLIERVYIENEPAVVIHENATRSNAACTCASPERWLMLSNEQNTVLTVPNRSSVCIF